jgi:hypothetical protein
MSTKDKLVQNVKAWLTNDKELKALQLQIKERKNKK